MAAKRSKRRALQISVGKRTVTVRLWPGEIERVRSYVAKQRTRPPARG